MKTTVLDLIYGDYSLKHQNISSCTPVKDLLIKFLSLGGTISLQKLSDYRFLELNFEISDLKDISNLVLPYGITNPKPGVYCCNCHCSTVKLIS